MDIPMLNDEEATIAYRLYGEGFKRNRTGLSRQERFQALLDYYFELTGFKETEPNAIMHHVISIYGPDCENCGKPYRTPRAKLCAACGHRRNLESEQE
jgi:hypothetical protein